MKNTAFCFIKPHAFTPECVKVVKQKLQDSGCEIKQEGIITGPEIDQNMYIDTHYYAIASKATMLQPSELPIPKEKFKETFGCEFDDMMSQGKVFNAKAACEVLGVDGEGLDKIWADAKKNKRLVKFGGGFYCGQLKDVKKADGTTDTIYSFNGFFMSMRGKFVQPDVKLQYFVVEFDQKTLAWEDFRGKVLGPTDPVDAPKDSLRGMVLASWKELGLTSCPNVGDNAVHASASPFEGLAERMNWLQLDPKSDEFGAAVLETLGEKRLKEWALDPQASYGHPKAPIKKSVFDSVEDLDADKCLFFLQGMAGQAPYWKKMACHVAVLGCGALLGVGVMKALQNK